ncbi:MAG: glycosyltransferase family 2 protein [Patescibacteria group bacterium]|jgi:GT2 family glycosyltransferase
MPEPISIVIPTRNRRDLLKECLASLKKQQGPFEIIVVNDASTDGTREFLNENAVQNLRLLENETQQGKSETRNRGVRAATHALITFIDDDCTAAPNWLAELRNGFAKDSTAFVIGETRYVADHYRGAFPERVVQNRNAVWPSTSNMAYRAIVFMNLGGFDAFYDRFNNEDTELGIRAVAAGNHFLRMPSARVFHQKSAWTAPALLAAAHNTAVMVHMKKKYPRHYQIFRKQFAFGVILRPITYLLLLFSPIVIPFLFFRYLIHGKRNIAIFFVKWPIFFILERFWIWHEAIKLRVLVL